MIEATFYQNSKQQVMRFCFNGHAEYAEVGKDIICSAVSVLFTNTLNAIEVLTDDTDNYELILNDEENAFDFRFFKSPTKESCLLIDALLLGLETIVEEYGPQYLNLTLKEV